MNRVLADREAQIELDDGTIVSGLDIVVSPDSVRFATRSGPPAVAVGRVSRITYERDRFSPGEGAGIGTLIGLGAVSIANLGSRDDSIVPYAVVAGVVVAGSALIGLVLGIAEEAGSQERVAYEGPITRYVPRDGE